jgi:hypothetical protein
MINCGHKSNFVSIPEKSFKDIYCCYNNNNNNNNTNNNNHNYYYYYYYHYYYHHFSYCYYLGRKVLKK